MRRRLLLLLLVLVATAARAAPPFMPVPIYPTGESSASSPVLGLICGRYVQPTTIVGATKMAVNVITGYGVGAHVNAMIFPDVDGGSPVAVMGPQLAVTAGVVAGTGITAFNLTGGLTYRACFCSETNSGAYAVPRWTPTTGFATLQNAFVASVGLASNSCGAGASAPATTGPLSADATKAPPLLLVSVE